MKNIALFCDGTWQTFDQWFPTNVADLARATLPTGKDGRIQVIYYDDGVGVAHGVADLSTELMGGAFGAGLDSKILQAYTFLCLNYEPGDQIFIFGFSRGAYTARCLAGLIHREWIVRRDKLNLVVAAMQDYRSQQRTPEQLQEYIAQNCCPLATGGITYLGVWDTVGELGIPSDLPFAEFIDKGLEFHDLELSAFVKSGRHAVSIDEHRKAFVPTLWSNIENLNASDRAAGKQYSDFAYQQVWFPGIHGSVGGGGPDIGISVTPLMWMADGARRAGLQFDQAAYDGWAHKRDDCVDFPQASNNLASELIDLIGEVQRMPGPATRDEISESALARWQKRKDYSPPQLTHLLGVKA